MVTGPRALVLRYHSLGDVVLATGVVRALRARGFSVHVVTERRFASIFRGSPDVAALHPREDWERTSAARSGRYDRVVDLQGTVGSNHALRDLGPVRRVRTRSFARRWVVLWGESAPFVSVPHAVLRYAEAAFPQDGGEALPDLAELQPVVQVAPGDREALARSHPALLEPGPPRVALLTGASRRSKAYPTGRFIEVGRRFAERGWDVLWVEAPSTGPDGVPATAAQGSEPIGRAPVGIRVAVGLGALKAALSTAQIAISGDSGPMHLATALGLSVVAVFGSSVRAFGFAPLGDRARVLEVLGLRCRPCGVHGRDRCWRGGFPCLDVPPERVFHEAWSLHEECAQRTPFSPLRGAR